jgi:hypothetical protein
MTTNYSMSDVLPKDVTGQPFQALADISTSQLDFALQAGLGASTVSGKRYASLAVATHKHGASVTTDSVGTLGFVKTDTPAAQAGNIQYLWGNTNGAVYTSTQESFSIVTSGSIAASAATAHSLFGTGLSAIGSSVILSVEVKAETNDGFLLRSNSLNGGGIWLSVSATQYEKLKPMTQATASALHFRNKVSNTTIHYQVWRKD